MKLYQTLIAVTLVFFSCSTPSPTVQLHQLMDDYHQEALQLYPLSATFFLYPFKTLLVSRLPMLHRYT